MADTRGLVMVVMSHETTENMCTLTVHRELVPESIRISRVHLERDLENTAIWKDPLDLGLVTEDLAPVTKDLGQEHLLLPHQQLLRLLFQPLRFQFLPSGLR
uniref:(northern house mosquito) hypothetical protein n=1 Tax=Culex pipiens TaxID=7175 RepID=A0A8D7ZZY8_CULPI